MNKVFRHDTITLNSNAKREDFEKFMKEELFPLFSKVFKGPTRSSKADIQSQFLLKETEGNKYLWISQWDGSPESVQGSSFERTRMSRVQGMEQTDAMLKRLEGFGKRTTEKVFSEIVRTKVTANT
jgi:hypothetical protein